MLRARIFLPPKTVLQFSLLPGISNANSENRERLWELDYNYLKQAKIIGMTTTGLSKYRGLIQSLKPKIVLVEEAAETLEAFVSVACFKTYVWHSSWQMMGLKVSSLEHLILVGDHLQLRGRMDQSL